MMLVEDGASGYSAYQAASYDVESSRIARVYLRDVLRRYPQRKGSMRPVVGQPRGMEEYKHLQVRQATKSRDFIILHTCQGPHGRRGLIFGSRTTGI